MADKEVTELRKAVGELAGHVLTLANRVYKEDKPDAPEEKGKDKEPDDDKDDKKGNPFAKGKKPVAKGYADTAQEAPDEESGKFGEEDSDVKGNEPSPAGDQSGDKEDETFNEGYKPGDPGLAKALGDITTALEGVVARLDKMEGGEGRQVVVAKAVTPPAGQRVPGRDGDGAEMTRELEEGAKGRSFKELNRLRMQVGDLPSNGLIR